MKISPLSVIPVFCIVLAQCIYASPYIDADSLDRRSMDSYDKRDGAHHHNPHVAPLLVLNETEVTMYHAPTPPSYHTLDWEDDGYENRHKGLMIFHGIFMCLAFFVSLPVGIAMRSVNHAAHGLVTLSFYGFCALGCAASGVYRKMTPNMYEGAVHRSQGYLVILVALSLSTLDIITAIRRFVSFIRSSDRSFKSFWNVVIKKQEPLSSNATYAGVVWEEPEEFESAKMLRESIDLQNMNLNDVDNTEQWANDVRHHQRGYSITSEGTVFGTHSPGHSSDTFLDAQARKSSSLRSRSLLRRIGSGVFAVVERSLVLAGFVQLLLGIVIYTGGCRQNYVNGCLAHLIKGGIFWCYGLLTFARFLGSFADLGWAWNRAASGDPYTAEFVESFVIFLYGAMNTWMERFGANPGDPFTTKQIQHISIAVMFWLAGLIGMGIESKIIRKWLAASVFPASSRPLDLPSEAVTEPPSYSGSFNPFPALVIGVTGAAMAAHAQTYLFQVEIHALWGNLLVAFAVLRCLTYFFLWLGPPRSVLPSRPPTEALGSFFLTCGGLVFMFSTEEVTIAAMRRGRDDVMMFLNLSVALTCLAFCWTLFVVGFKGWLKSRIQSSVTYRTSA